MLIASTVGINSTYLVLGALVYAGTIAKPTYVAAKKIISKFTDESDFKQRTEEALWGAEPTKYEPNPPHGLVDQFAESTRANREFVESVHEFIKQADIRFARLESVGAEGKS